MSSEIFVGTIVSWQPERGFGFLKLDGSAESLFVHRSRLIAAGIEPLTITVGTRLQVDRIPSKRRPGSFEGGGFIKVLGGEVPEPVPFWRRGVDDGAVS